MDRATRVPKRLCQFAIQPAAHSSRSCPDHVVSQRLHAAASWGASSSCPHHLRTNEDNPSTPSRRLANPAHCLCLLVFLFLLGCLSFYQLFIVVLSYFTYGCWSDP